MCTVLLQLTPGEDWPLLMGAVRDEFLERPWDPPAAHWTGTAAGLLGGRDHTAGGTWLAVDPSPRRPAVGALLNGVRRPPIAEGVRPTRGTLVVDALARGRTPTPESIVDHDGFHLVVATLDAVDVWSWDGEALQHRRLDPGRHIVVNLGVDALDDPLVPHFTPLLDALPAPRLLPGLDTASAWAPWTDLLAGDGLDPEDPRALLVEREIEGRRYGSSSACLVALAPDAVRYDFTPDPWRPEAWYEVTASTAHN